MPGKDYLALSSSQLWLFSTTRDWKLRENYCEDVGGGSGGCGPPEDLGFKSSSILVID